MTPLVPIHRVSGEALAPSSDRLAVEAPLEFRLVQGPERNRRESVLAVTMRTPGRDAELAAGFLFAEGIVSDPASIEGFSSPDPNRIVATLAPGDEVAVDRARRTSYTNSSCGVCGKASLESLEVENEFSRSEGPGPELVLAPGLIHALPGALRAAQGDFDATGGLHAAGLFDENGAMILAREDVGRHNAVDKAVGAALLRGLLPLRRRILMLSGRASFELVQKAALAGIPVVAAVGAPSTAAVELAVRSGITLLGFVRNARFNVYAAHERIGVPAGAPA